MLQKRKCCIQQLVSQDKHDQIVRPTGLEELNVERGRAACGNSQVNEGSPVARLPLQAFAFRLDADQNRQNESGLFCMSRKIVCHVPFQQSVQLFYHQRA